jgi:homoserine/homoserine lactone efflux protein
MNSSVILLYLCTWSLVAISPGPAVMCSMEHSTRFGFKASLIGIAGIQAGNLLFFLATALGLASFLAAGTVAFLILRIVGASYLFYLGSRIIWSTFKTSSVALESIPREFAPRRSLFVHGLLIQITNPKALLFVSALLPQFILPGRPLAPQIMLLATVTIAVDLSVLSTYAFVADRGISVFRKSNFALWLERLFGGVLIFFGVRLLGRK